MNTLCNFSINRAASLTKLVRNKPKVNVEPKDSLLREFQTEIAR